MNSLSGSDSLGFKRRKNCPCICIALFTSFTMRFLYEYLKFTSASCSDSTQPAGTESCMDTQKGK